MVNLWRERPESSPITESELADMCAAFQEEAFDQLVRKTAIVSKQRPEAKNILVAGGVAANECLRRMIHDKLKLRPHFPHPRFCADNGAMIACYGYHLARFQRVNTHDMGWDAYSRYGFNVTAPKEPTQ
jgi:N6-L-threonylcarbamoyladenine synthase